MILYLVTKVRKWEELRFEHDIVRVQPEEWHYGFCPVFEDYGTAVECAGGPEYVQIVRIL